MNEYSFIEFDVTDNSCKVQLPVNSISDLRFFIPATMEGEALSVITILDEDFNLIRNCDFDFADGFVALKNTSIADLTCFRFNFYYTSGDPYYSNLFRYVSETTETILLKYKCNASEFGFDYDIENSYNQVRLPIRLRSAQFPQEEKIYTDSNGVRKQLFAKIDKEWELETEYIPVEWHEKLIIALAHDEVYFDGEKLQKSAEYVINYEDEDVMDCGIKLYKATAKLTKNQTIRNSYQ